VVAGTGQGQRRQSVRFDNDLRKSSSLQPQQPQIRFLIATLCLHVTSSDQSVLIGGAGFPHKNSETLQAAPFLFEAVSDVPDCRSRFSIAAQQIRRPLCADSSV
jgi:hypothetical protein